MNIHLNPIAPSIQAPVPPQTYTSKATLISLIALGVISCAAVIHAAPFLAGAHITVLTVKILSSILPLISFVAAAILYTRAASQAKEATLQEKKLSLERNFLSDKAEINEELIKYLKIVKEEFENEPDVIAYKETSKFLQNLENVLTRGKDLSKQKASLEEKLKTSDLTPDQKTSLLKEIRLLTGRINQEGITLQGTTKKNTQKEKETLEKLTTTYNKLKQLADALSLDRAAKANKAIIELEQKYHKALSELEQTGLAV